MSSTTSSGGGDYEAETSWGQGASRRAGGREMARRNYAQQQNLPVFVFPQTLQFFAKDPHSHKQVLTLYNPYDFTLSFQVLSTNPKKYGVTDSEGLVKARSCVDIIIRHLSVDSLNVGITDKFRIHVQDYETKETLGRKDVAAVLLEVPLPDDVPSSSFEFQPLGSKSPRKREPPQPTTSATSTTRDGSAMGASPNLFAVLVGIACVVSLSFPTQGENSSHSSFVPDYFHLTMSQKLVAAYILGLVTMVLLRP